MTKGQALNLVVLLCGIGCFAIAIAACVTPKWVVAPEDGSHFGLFAICSVTRCIPFFSTTFGGLTAALFIFYIIASILTVRLQCVIGDVHVNRRSLAIGSCVLYVFSAIAMVIILGIFGTASRSSAFDHVVWGSSFYLAVTSLAVTAILLIMLLVLAYIFRAPVVPRSIILQPTGGVIQMQGGFVNQGVYVNPQGVHVNPQGVHVNPQGVHVNPQGVHVNPQGVYVNPQGVHVNPQGGYVYPQGGYINQGGVAQTQGGFVNQEGVFYPQGAVVGAPDQVKYPMEQPPDYSANVDEKM